MYTYLLHYPTHTETIFITNSSFGAMMLTQRYSEIYHVSCTCIGHNGVIAKAG